MGLGGWGRNLVKSVQGKSDKAQFAAAVVRTPANATEFAAEHGLALSDDPASILNDPSIDGVIVVGPAHLHAAAGQQALDAGKHTMVIKPFALSGADAEAMCKTADEKGLVVALGFDRCFLPVVDALRERVSSGALGQIMHAEGNFCAARYYNMSEDDWKSLDANSPPGSLADHILYLMIEMLGPVEELSVEARNAVTTVDLSDHVTVGLRFADGVTGNMTAIGVTPAFERLQIFGTEGWVEIRDRTRIEFRPVTGDPEISEVDLGSPLLSQVEAFADAIAGDAPYPVSPANAANSAAAMEAMLRSKEKGGWQKL